MPAASKQQQKFMGIVRAIQKGDVPASKFSKAAQKAAKSMDKKSVKKYAATKHDDLPKKVKEMYDSILNENPAAIAAAQRMVVQNKAGNKVSVNTARQSSYAQKDPSAHKKAKSLFQRLKDRFSKKENVNEAFAIQYKKDKRYLTRKELFDKKPLKFKTEDEAKSMLNGLDYKYRTNYKIVKIKEGVNELTSGQVIATNIEVALGRADRIIRDAIKDSARRDRRKGIELMKLYKKHFVEFAANARITAPLEEGKDTKVIDQLRKIVQNKQMASVKDPKTGRRMKVDGYSASAIVQVYDKLNLSNKKKFTNLPLDKMQTVAFKFVK
tara:strand:+ start:269 stop:1243 length:975 start_codon:yes stop_codon:yes gene_type:complete